jgi:single stranded DNA-binding protein
MSFAKVVLAGTLTQQAELRSTTNNTSVAVLQLQVPQALRAQGQAPAAATLRVTCWRGLAEQAAQLQVGQAVLVEGRLQIYTQPPQPDGVQKKSFEVDANSLYLLPAVPQQVMVATERGQAGPPAPRPQQAPPAYAPQTPPAAAAPQPVPASPALSDLSPDEFLSEDDIPF